MFRPQRVIFRPVVLKYVKGYECIFFWRCDQFMMFLDHTQRRTTVGRTHLDEWSARRRDLCLTTHNIHDRRTSMPPVGIESTISAGERPQTHTLDRAATGAGLHFTQPLLQKVPSNYLLGKISLIFTINSKFFRLIAKTRFTSLILAPLTSGYYL